MPPTEDINERFTVPGSGERAVYAMSVDDVVAAVDWHEGEAERLKRESDAAEARVTANLSAATPNELKALIDMMAGAHAAMEKANRLLGLIMARCPPAYADVTLREGLPKWWGT
jgi:hypothetical protein